ncbi:MAG: DEAD/DEAH box helicase family protein, partial [Pirellulaceae bacterium]
MLRPSRIDKLIAKCKSWKDFTRALAPRNAAEKGDAFERLTQLYLLTRPEFGGTKLRDVWVCKWDLPTKIRTKLKLPKADEGIDLVAQARDGSFWAIQSKYKSDQDKPPTRKELSTFASLAFINCRGCFSEAWVAHSSSRPVRKGKLAGHTSEIGLEAWLALSREDWGLIHKRLKGKAARPTRRKPRPHQTKAIKAATEHFAKKRQSRGKLIMPCGTGKSLTAYWIAKALKAKTILVAVPSLALIKQGVEDWTREIVATNEKPLAEWLCVCSDESAGNIERDQFVGDVYELGLDVTTEPEKIKSFLTKPTTSRRIVFTTYQSSPLLANVARKAGVEFDLAILDEAHKTAGAKGKTFATLLFDKNLRIRRRI